MEYLNRAIELADEVWKKSGFDVHALPPAMQVVQLISQLEFEVALGGVMGWLMNSSGKYAGETVSALERIGARQCASLLRRALAIFPDGVPSRDGVERASQVERYVPRAEAVWREVGDQLLQWPEDVQSLLEKFILANVSEFPEALLAP